MKQFMRFFAIRKLGLIVSVAAVLLSVTQVQAAETLAGTNAELDSNLAALKQQAANIQQQVADANGQIAGLEHRRAVLQTKLDATQDQLNRSLRDDYIAGPATSLEVIASTDTLSGVVGQQAYRQGISSKSQTVSEQLKVVKQEINHNLTAAQNHRNSLLGLQSQYQKSIADAQAQIDAKNALAAMTQNQEAQFQQVKAVQQTQDLAPSSGVDGLIGSIGYARPGGNCVNEPGVNNPGYGNPINWPVTSSTPSIGATALWTYNHTGVVTGLWSNGDIEVRHQNYWGGQHRFPRSAFRGFR